MRVAVIDYGMGNLGSVRNAFASVGAETEVVCDPEALRSFSHIVLPGVGAFADGIRNLRSRGWEEELRKMVLGEEKPFLGICLGMQLLAEKGHEGGCHDGLGWFKGRVVRFKFDDISMRVPHVGWNDVVPARQSGIYAESINEPRVFYFVHSYHFIPDEADVVDGWCDYGGRFAASVSQGNVWAVQYHPEKSHKAGLQVLRDFLVRNA